jgi:hypothetical protein
MYSGGVTTRLNNNNNNKFKSNKNKVKFNTNSNQRHQAVKLQKDEHCNSNQNLITHREHGVLINSNLRPNHAHTISDFNNYRRMLNSRLKINVAGKLFELCEYHVLNFPASLLGVSEERSKYYDRLRDEHFFDRSREAFEGILHFYQTNGSVEIPGFVPIDHFYEELKFFKLDKELNSGTRCDESLLILALKDQLNDVDEKYSNQVKTYELKKKIYLEKKEIKNKFKGLRYLVDDDDEDEALFFYLEEEYSTNKIPLNKYQRYLWLTMERPNSSLFGRIVAFICLITVIMSVMIMCMETMIETTKSLSSGYNFNLMSKFQSRSNYFQQQQQQQLGGDDYDAMIERRFEFYLLEFICNLVFTIELTLRLIATPNRCKFIKSFANIIDVIAILPFWSALAINQLNLFGNFRFFGAQQTTKSSFLTTKASNQGHEHSDSSPGTLITTTLATIISTTTKRQTNQYGLSVLRILRLTRVLRVLKLSRHIHALNLMGKILYECLYEIILLLTFLAMNIVIFSSFMYYIELQALGDNSPFISKQFFYQFLF